jgi:hypothetical protein
MSEQMLVQIEVEAAKALVQWKAQFAEEVCERAKQLASQSSEPSVVTLRHYKQAARIALQALSAAIDDGAAPDAEQRAA